jgi:hypothetical protein
LATYPNGFDAFTTHQDNVGETIAAQHANALQTAVVAVEGTLGTNPQGNYATLKDRLAAIDAAVANAAASAGYSPPVATTSTRGILRLSGDLSGTADAPRLTQLPNLATVAYADEQRKVKPLGQVSGTVTLDLTQAYNFSMTAVGDVTIAVTGWSTKAFFQHVTVQIAQDATGGRKITWPARFSTNSTMSGLSTAANSYVLFEFASMDIGSTVSLWAQPGFAVPVQSERYDASVLGLSNLMYYIPAEETAALSTITVEGISKVLFIIEENHTLAQMQAGMTYLNGLSTTYGYASNWTAISHPSLPNYFALTYGTTFGISDDNNPPSHNTAQQSIFGQALAAGKTAKTYAETMPSNNYTSDSGNYAVHHNPWCYSTAEATAASQYNVPLGTTTSGNLFNDIANNNLPNVGFIVPNMINDAHDGTLGQADTWLSTWMPQILSTPDFQAGRLLVVITADEDDGSGGNKVLTTVVHPSTKGKGAVSTALNHYSLVRFVGEMLGKTPLGSGNGAPSLSAAFGLSTTPTSAPGSTAPATDISGVQANGTYSGTFSFANISTVPTSQKFAPTFVAANHNFISNDSNRRAAGTAAWSLGFTIKATDPGLSAQEVIYAETLSSDSTTGQGLYIESGTTALSGGRTAANLRLTNNSGSNLVNKVLGAALFDGFPHHVVVSFDGGNTYSVYIDGVLTDTVVQAPTAATVDRATWGARRRSSTDRYFSGGLGRLWLRSTATTPAEVTSLYASYGTGGGGSGSAGGGTGGGGTTYDSHGVLLHAPQVTVNNSAIVVTAQVDRNATTNFAYLQIAVRPPAGSGGTAFSTAYTPGTQTGSGTQTITGSGSCDVAGTWTAFATYSLVANPVQADWVDGVQSSFVIAGAVPPDPNTGGGGGGGTSGGLAFHGMSGATAANGGDDAWIGKPIDIAGTWNDTTPDGQINVYNIQPGNEYGSWNRAIDLSIGGIFGGETWAQAAAGNFDQRWQQSWTNIKKYWGSRDPSKLFVRFAHEFSGNWYNWKVTGSDTGNFIAAWKRMYAIKQSIMPLASLVWCPNDGTSGDLGLNVLDAWPGSAYVDVYGVDTYNHDPWRSGTSLSDFNSFLNNGLGTQNPQGPEAHRRAALALGVPFAVPEWSSDGNGGDAPDWVNRFMDWIFLYQGTGAGQIKYHVQFNLWNQFIFNPTSLQPNAANAFKARMLARA